MRSRVFAYCRVSTAEQISENQIREIEAAGFHLELRRIISGTVSGSTPAMERAGFRKLIERLDWDDVLVVTKLDRLGRDAMDVRATVERLAEMKVRVHCLALGGLDLTSAAGKMTMAVIAAVAEFERDLLIERTQAGLSRAKSQGKRLGRPRSLTNQQIEVIQQRRAMGVSSGELAKEFGVSRSAIQRAERVCCLGASTDSWNAGDGFQTVIKVDAQNDDLCASPPRGAIQRLDRGFTNRKHSFSSGRNEKMLNDNHNLKFDQILTRRS